MLKSVEASHINSQSELSVNKPASKPKNPKFSSGPSRKHPGWSLANFSCTNLGRSHRAAKPRTRIREAIKRSAEILTLPHDWKLAIVPASDTGAFELAMWSMLGERGVDVFAWESFSKDWAFDIKEQLKLDNVNYYRAEYGELPDMSQADPKNDCVFVYNGTTSGVRVPNLDWISEEREGLVLCDATSAAFAMKMDFSKLDAVTWSWQKVLGGEGGFGMLALSPRAIERLEQFKPDRGLPKIFRMTKNGKLDESLFKGSTLNSPSLLVIEDLMSALNWATSIGGLNSLVNRCNNNFKVVNNWVEKSDWIRWLPNDPETRSTTAMCLLIKSHEFTRLDSNEQIAAVDQMSQWLKEEDVAYDIGSYRTAPTGFRLWGGATVESSDLEKLLPWLDWAYQRWLEEME